jgi:hypothetical protein
MYASGYSKTKKLEYERALRAKNRVEKREAQVLKPWLKKKYAGVYEEFTRYYERLEKAYPTVKNLAVTREFKQFVGMFCLKYLYFCYIFCV